MPRTQTERGRYIFTVTKKLNKELVILAENKEEAVENLIEIALKSNAIDFKNNKEIDTELEAVLEESEPINDTEILDKSINIKDTFSEEELKNFIEENEEIEDDLPNEYEEIVCENCGNTIRLDEIL